MVTTFSDTWGPLIRRASMSRKASFARRGSETYDANIRSPKRTLTKRNSVDYIVPSERDAFTADTPHTVGLMHLSNHLHLFLYLLHSTQTISALFLYQTGNLPAEASPTLILPHVLNETIQVESLDYHCIKDGPSIRNIPRARDCRHIADYLMPLSLLTSTSFTEVSFMVIKTSTSFHIRRFLGPALLRSTFSQDSQRRAPRGLL